MHDQQEKQKTILLVEDEAVIAMIEEQTLKRHGFNVIVAPSGEKAVSIVKNTPDIDLILMDINLGKGKMDGTEAAEIILKDNDIPVLFLSSYNQAEVVQKTEQITSYGYVVKDSGETVLITSIKMAFKLSDAHQRLNESETRFRRISAITSDIAYSCRTEEDGRFSIDWMTGAADRITGYSSEEIKAQGCWRFMVVEDDIALFEENVIALAPGSQGSCELRIRHKNGDVVWISSFAECVSEKQIPGRLSLYGGLADITARKRSEEALREIAEKYHSIFENAVEGFFQSTPEGRFLTVNPAFARIFGYASPEELISTISNISQQYYVNPENRLRYMEILQEKGTVENFEINARRKDGAAIWISNSTRTIVDKEGRIIRYDGIVEDVTSRKQAEEALRKSEEKYRDIFNNAIEGIYQSTPDGRYLNVNPAFARICGYDSTEEMTASISDIARQLYVNPKDREKWKEFLAASGTVENFETQFYRKDGSKIWVSFSGHVVKDEEDNLLCYEGAMENISKRKQAEDALRESQELEKGILLSVPHALFGVEQRRIFFANDAMEDVFGWKPDELIGKSTRVIFRNDKEWEDYGALLYSQLKMQSVFVFESDIPFVRKDGTEIICRMSVSRIGKQLGESRRIVATFEDITERRWAEEKLKAAEEIYRNIFMNAQIGLFRTDIEKGMMLEANDSMAQFAGFKNRKDLLSSNFNIAERYIDPEARKNMLALVKEHGQLDNYETQFRRNDGEIRWIRFSAKLVPDKGWLEGVSEDITDRKHADNKIQDALDSLTKAFGTIIQVMVTAVESRDPYTAGHQNRSADLARAIATEMGLSLDKIDAISMAGSIHDIGKLSIPAEILAKPTKLSEIELPLVKQHAQRGYEMLKDVESPWPLAEIVYQHHERMDGSGYPRCLKGEEILMEARILAVADVVESMASHRPYRPALGLEAALAEIENNKMTLYDADVVDACLRLFREKDYQLQEA